MPVGFSNLSQDIKAKLAPDLGQVFYVVDDDYRTVAQGWSKADKTGPMDLFAARQAGGGQQYVFRHSDYSSDAVAMQAAIDAAVDFRGDTLFLPPGAPSWGTALSIDVPNLRITGTPVSRRERAFTTITDTVGSHVVTGAADNLEVSYFKFVPKTATKVFSVSASADYLHFHDFVHDTRGVAASTSTNFATVAGVTATGHMWENFTAWTDEQQGPTLLYPGATDSLTIRDYVHWHAGGKALAVALMTMTSGTPTGVLIEKVRGNLNGLASTAVTNLIVAAESGGDVSSIRLIDVRCAIGFCAASALVSLGAAEAAEIGLAACYLDVVSGGAGGLGTAFTA